MRWIHRLRHLGRALTASETLDAEFDEALDEELRFHIDQQIAQFVGQGMDPATARTEALRLFGGVEKVKEECRDERRVRLIDNLVQDVSFALRTLRTAKGFAFLTVITLALGIGANTAIFSVVNGVLLAPLPYPEGDDLMLLEASKPQLAAGATRFSIREFFAFRDQLDELDLVEYHGMSFTLFGHGYPSSVETGVVSYNFFDVLGVEPQLGRFFIAADEQQEAEAVLVLSDRYWREQFDADPHIVGRVFEMNDRPHRVIGVLPSVPLYPGDADVYMPSTACPLRGVWEPVDDSTPLDAFAVLSVLGRIGDNVEARRAGQAVASMADEMTQAHADHYGDAGMTVAMRPLQTVLTERARPLLLVLLGTVGLVLLVACANAANLMVARVMRRDRELALRAAMGAGRGRLLRQLLTESTLLSLAGGALGLAFAAAGLDLLVDFTARFTPRVQDIQIDGWVLVFTLVVSFLTGIAFGVLPGMWIHTDVLAGLREGGNAQSTTGRATLRVRGALIAAQVALSFMLLIGAGLLVNSFIKLSRVDTGFGAANVFIAQVSPNWSEYVGLGERAQLYGDLLGALEGGPEVVSAAVANTVPLAHGMIMTSSFLVDERPSGLAISAEIGRHDTGTGVIEEGWSVDLSPIGISANYFETVGLAVLEGRALTRAEVDGARRVALVSESARQRYWPDEGPIGRKVAIGDPTSEFDTVVWHTIVGVVGDARHYGLDLEEPPALFASYRSFGGAGALLVRTTADAQTMSAFIQETMARIAPLQAVGNFQTMRSLRSAALATPRLTAALLSLFAGLALLITVVGIGGAVAFSVGQRTREIGIRMALGAERGAVLSMVLRQGLSMVLVGLVLGVGGALWFGGVVASFLFETEPTDPATFFGVALVLLGATVVACLVPARRATSIDPVLALRVD